MIQLRTGLLEKAISEKAHLPGSLNSSQARLQTGGSAWQIFLLVGGA